MKAVKRVPVVDPDTGDRAVRTTVDRASLDAASVEALRQMIDRKSIGARLRKARALLTEIAGTPEHDAAIEVLDRGQAVSPNDPEVERAWLEFCALYEHAQRRIAGRKIQSARSVGIKNSAKVRKEKNAVRNAQIVADSPWHTRADLATKHGLTERHIRTILEQTEKKEAEKKEAEKS